MFCCNSLHIASRKQLSGCILSFRHCKFFRSHILYSFFNKLESLEPASLVTVGGHSFHNPLIFMIIQQFMLPKLLWILSYPNRNMAIAYMISESLIQLVFFTQGSYTLISPNTNKNSRAIDILMYIKCFKIYISGLLTQYVLLKSCRMHEFLGRKKLASIIV